MKPTTIVIFAAASISTAVVAQTERDLGSHEHGSASMNVALDQNSLLIELESPWDNLVGFEHAPSTDEQHALIDGALDLLNHPKQLFTFNGVTCVATEIEIDSSLPEGDDDHHDGHDDHDDHKDGHDDHDDHEDGHDDHDDHEDGHDDHDDHEDGHDDHDDHEDGHDDHDDHEDGHDDHDDHEDGHDDHGDEEGVHSSVLAIYSFGCDDVAKLASIDVKFLEIWSGFDDLDVQLIGPGGQDAAELNPEKIRLDMTSIR